MAEQRLAKISRAAGKANGWHVFESVRIPDVEQGGKQKSIWSSLAVTCWSWSKTLVRSFEINAEEEFIQHRENGPRTTTAPSISESLANPNASGRAQRTRGKDDDVDVRVVPRSPTGTSTGRERDTYIVKDEAGFIGLLESEPGQLNEARLKPWRVRYRTRSS